jgi:4-diphosphocytidyl-2-C-methyl-D-erythritol kinase
MKLYSRAKINLFLDIVGQDPLDGYHYIDSLFQEITLCDVIDMNKASEDIVEFEPDSELNKNSTVHKALKLFKERFGIKTCYSIKVKKNIPIGSGLGGGSSNAATVLRFLAKEYRVPFDDLLEIAKNIGSDVPFFLYGGLCRVSGKGELVRKLSHKLKNVYFLIICPDIFISTKEAYSLIKDKNSVLTFPDLENISLITIDFLKKIVYNKFQKIIFNNFSSLGILYENLKKHLKAEIIFMSGSGSSLVAVYDNRLKRMKDFLYLKRQKCFKVFMAKPFYSVS